MNNKKIIFSSVVTGAVGAGLGLVVLYIAPCPYSSQLYKNLESKYLAIGAVAGLLIGASQEAVRELKQERDEEEAIAQQNALSNVSFLRSALDETYLLEHNKRNDTH